MSLAGGKISLEFPPGEEETAGVIAGACDEALRLARTLWGLEPPTACHLLVMTSWKGFIFRSAPWPWKLMLGATFPVWSPWARQAWPYSAGWTQRFGRKVAIGIKPPRLLETSDKSIGAHMYIEEKDPSAKIRHLTCHELMHAASAHLVLPAWLNEGLAAVTVDRFMGKPTIREDTLALVQRHLPKGPPRTYRQLSRLPGEAVAYHAVRGYWIVRLLEETHPGFVRGLLATRQLHRAAERQVAERLGLRPASLWRDVDDLVVTHFRSRGLTAD
jgi:hypothetical protein